MQKCTVQYSFNTRKKVPDSLGGLQRSRLQDGFTYMKGELKLRSKKTKVPCLNKIRPYLKVTVTSSQGLEIHMTLT